MKFVRTVNTHRLSSWIFCCCIMHIVQRPPAASWPPNACDVIGWLYLQHSSWSMAYPYLLFFTGALHQLAVWSSVMRACTVLIVNDAVSQYYDASSNRCRMPRLRLLLLMLSPSPCLVKITSGPAAAVTPCKGQHNHKFADNRSVSLFTTTATN